jgi:hypothetical protein
MVSEFIYCKNSYCKKQGADHLGLAGARVVLIDLKKMGVVGQAHLDNF